MPRKSAIEILVWEPNPAIPLDKRGVHENLWIKQRFEQYVSIGVFVGDAGLRYYRFEQVGREPGPRMYSSLAELREEEGLEEVFAGKPKLFVMGHARGNYYGLGNYPQEINEENFNKIVTDFVHASPEQQGKISVTLEACNTDNLEQAVRGGQEKTFLERLSATFPNITVQGTGPWSPNEPQTGYRASGGFPTLNAPITSMGGSIWKSGNRVIFHHNGVQMAVRKSKFASQETAKALKINTVDYARAVLENAALENSAALFTEVCMRRDVLKIEDLEKISGFPASQGNADASRTVALREQESQIIAQEKRRYILRVTAAVERAERDEVTERDLLIIALGLQDQCVFEGHEALLDRIADNPELLSLLMVSCGKVLLASPNNDNAIDWLLSKGADINSTDVKGMTALHYAVQNFFNYRAEPLHLIETLLEHGADREAANAERETPRTLAEKHTQDSRMVYGDALLSLLNRGPQLEGLVASDSTGSVQDMTSYSVIARQLGSIAAAPAVAESAVLETKEEVVKIERKVEERSSTPDALDDDVFSPPRPPSK